MPPIIVMTFMFRSWWESGEMSHPEMLEGLAKAGAKGVEPFHRDFAEDPQLLTNYRRWLADTGMQAPVVDVICNLVTEDAEQKRQAIDEMKRGLEICKGLGASIAHVAGNRLRDGISPEDGRKMIADGMLEVSSLADSYGLILAIEDFDPAPTLVCSARDCIEIMQLTGDRVKFVFDTGNFIAAGETADEVFPLFAGRICHFHFKDFIVEDGKLRRCKLGDGVIPNAAIAAEIGSMDYDGWVALETMQRDDVHPIEAVRTELPLLRSWLDA